MRLWLLPALLMFAPGLAQAKKFGAASPAGREIYDDRETFAEARDQNRRLLIVEVVSGLAPEGNLGMLLGIINFPWRGLEPYAGVAYDLAPGYSGVFHARYFLNIHGVRPYLAAGYCYRRLEDIGIDSHNVFVELGHKWVIERTLHLTLGVGVRRPLVVNVLDDSPLSSADVDPVLLAEQLDESRSFYPTFALRVSRAF